MQMPRVLPMIRRLRAGLGLVAVLLFALLWLALPIHPKRQRYIARTGWKMLLAAFGIEVRVIGRPQRESLLVANHLSWADIPALALVAEAPFVAKAEVRKWPLIGRLAQKWGCVFIERERRHNAKQQAEAAQRQLKDGDGLILFPEGTTGMGWEVQPFRSSLFVAPPGDRPLQVQPVALRYCNRDGSPHQAEQRRRVAWLDDDRLLPHAFGLAASGGARLELIFTEPLSANCRKQLAVSSSAAISALLAATSC